MPWGHVYLFAFSGNAKKEKNMENSSSTGCNEITCVFEISGEILMKIIQVNFSGVNFSGGNFMRRIDGIHNNRTNQRDKQERGTKTGQHMSQ